MKTLAFVCRYGHVGVSDVLEWDSKTVKDFADALEEIVGEERRSNA